MPAFWCLSCKKDATDDCIEEHPIRSLKKARIEDAAPVLEALEQGEAALDKLDATVNAFGDQLKQEKAAWATAKNNLQAALGADADVWNEAKQAAVQTGQTRNAVQLVANVHDPSAKCTVSLTCAGEVWRGDVEPAKDAAARLLLWQLSRSGGLQHMQQRDGEPHQQEAEWNFRSQDLNISVGTFVLAKVESKKFIGFVTVQEEEEEEGDVELTLLHLKLPATKFTWPNDLITVLVKVLVPRVQHWCERSNIGKWRMPLAEMDALMKTGSRVVRGRDWQHGDVDGVPPGPGTVDSRKVESICVKWDHNGLKCSLSLWNSTYPLLLQPSPLKPYNSNYEGDYFFDATSCIDTKAMAKMLVDGSLSQVRSLVGLPCSGAPFWSQMVLEKLAPRLEGLQMVGPLQHHLNLVLTMPHLRALCLTDVTGEQVQQVSQMASLHRLELHCSFEAPLPVLSFTTIPSRLRWLRCGVYPLESALGLVRAHADTLEELQLVAASALPYGCPDLARQLQNCQLKKLTKMVLLRQTGYAETCSHDKASCRVQTRRLWDMFVESSLDVLLMCSLCDEDNFRKK